MTTPNCFGNKNNFNPGNVNNNVLPRIPVSDTESGFVDDESLGNRGFSSFQLTNSVNRTNIATQYDNILFYQSQFVQTPYPINTIIGQTTIGGQTITGTTNTGFITGHFYYEIEVFDNNPITPRFIDKKSLFINNNQLHRIGLNYTVNFRPIRIIQRIGYDDGNFISNSLTLRSTNFDILGSGF